MGIIDEFRKNLADYKNDMLNVLIDEGTISESEANDYVDSRELNEMIFEDLTDKNFNYHEVNEIIMQQGSNDTMYKFLAYFIATESEYNSVDELKYIIETSSYHDITNYTLEDFNKIFEAYKKIDF